MYHLLLRKKFNVFGKTLILNDLATFGKNQILEYLDLSPSVCPLGSRKQIKKRNIVHGQVLDYLIGKVREEDCIYLMRIAIKLFFFSFKQ